MNLSGIRIQVEALTSDLRKSPRVAEKLYAARAWLNPDALQLVREAQHGAEGRRATRLKQLAVHLANLIASVSCADLLDETAAVSVSMVSREADRDARAEADRNEMNGLATLDTAFARAWDVRRAALSKLGVPSFAAQWSEQHDCSTASLTQEAESFLSETESMYLEVFAWWLRRSTGQRLFPDGAQRHDLLFALSLASFNGLFPSEAAINSLAGEFRGTGLDVSVAVSGFRAESGLTSTRDFLRAFGETSHFALADTDGPFEDRLLGDDSLPRGIGVLFQNTLLERHWIARAFGSEPADVRRLMALAELTRLRTAAAVLVATLEVDRDGWGARSAGAFVERLSRASGVAWPPALARWSCGFDLDSATALRAAAFEAALLPALRNACDEDWWRNPRTEQFLSDICKSGQLLSSGATAKSLSLGELTLTAVARRLQSVLG